MFGEGVRKAFLLFIPYVAAFLSICYCVRRDACTTQASFDVSVENHASPSTAIASFQNKTKLQCLLECASVKNASAVNFHASTGKCLVFSEPLIQAVRALVKKDGWTYISTSGKQPDSKCERLNPCLNGGTCVENCKTEGFSCICDEFHYGKRCEKDLQDLLDAKCLSLSFGILQARYGGGVHDINDYAWRCYKIYSLTEDGLYFSGTSAVYYTLSSTLQKIYKDHQKGSEYGVAALNNSCDEHCSSLGKTCNQKMRTVDTIYQFALAGVSCKYPKDKYGSFSAYHQQPDEPAFIPSDGYCYGFARVPSQINCAAKSSLKRRLCRCK